MNKSQVIAELERQLDVLIKQNIKLNKEVVSLNEMASLNRIIQLAEAFKPILDQQPAKERITVAITEPAPDGLLEAFLVKEVRHEITAVKTSEFDAKGCPVWVIDSKYLI